MSLKDRIREKELQNINIKKPKLLNDFKYEKLESILREAYKHPELSWIDNLFEDIKNKIKDLDNLELDPKKTGNKQIINLYFPQVEFEIDDEEGFGSESILGGLWDEYKKIPICEISKDFLKNFRSNSAYDFDDCKNAFRSFITHELAHEHQNKILDEEDDIGVFDIVENYDGPDTQKYVMQYHEFDAHARSIAQALLDYGLDKKDILIKLQIPSEVKKILEFFYKHHKKAYLTLNSFYKRKKDFRLWNKFIRKIYDYLYNDVNITK